MGNEKQYDWATIIEQNREAVREAMIEAYEMSLRNAKDEFVVYLWENGETEIFQNTGNEYKTGEGLREIKSFRSVGWTPEEWYNDPEVMLDDIKAVMDENEIAELNKATEQNELDEFEQIEWTKENAPNAYNNAYEWAIEQETAGGNGYDEMIDIAISDEKQEQKEIRKGWL